MSSVQTPTKVSNRASFLDKPVAGRTAGIVVLFALSLLLLLLSLPFFPWIILSAPGALFRSIGVTDYSKIYGGYTLYNFLSVRPRERPRYIGFPFDAAIDFRCGRRALSHCLPNSRFHPSH